MANQPLPTAAGFRIGMALTLILTGAVACVGERVVPQTTPLAIVVTQPQPSAPPAATDWRDLPATPGDWTWRSDTSGSVAQFGDGLVALRCDRARARIELSRASQRTVNASLTVTTTSSASRVLASELTNGGPGALTALLPATDPLFDAMAFSRGRFLIAAPGLATLSVPAWPELARTIEDCRPPTNPGGSPRSLP